MASNKPSAYGSIDNECVCSQSASRDSVDVRMTVGILDDLIIPSKGGTRMSATNICQFQSYKFDNFVTV
jgi:hypothetical protein